MSSDWVDSAPGTLTILGCTLAFYAVVFGAMWWRLGGYEGRHRGVYKPPPQPVKPVKPILLGETYITVYLQMQGFGENAIAAMRDMVNFRVPIRDYCPDEYTDHRAIDPEARWVLPDYKFP